MKKDERDSRIKVRTIKKE